MELPVSQEQLLAFPAFPVEEEALVRLEGLVGQEEHRVVQEAEANPYPVDVVGQVGLLVDLAVVAFPCLGVEDLAEPLVVLVAVVPPFLEEAEDQVARRAAQEVAAVPPLEVEEAQGEHPVGQVVLACPYLEALVDRVEEGQVVQEAVEVLDPEVQEERVVH